MSGWPRTVSIRLGGLGYIEGRGKGKEKDRDEMKSVNYKCRLVVAPFRWRHDDGARFCVVML